MSILAMVEVIRAPSKDLLTFLILSMSKFISMIAFEDIGLAFGSTLLSNRCKLYFFASLC